MVNEVSQTMMVYESPTQKRWMNNLLKILPVHKLPEGISSFEKKIRNWKIVSNDKVKTWGKTALDYTFDILHFLYF